MQKLNASAIRQLQGLSANLELHVKPETTAEQREQVLQQWYREQLKQLIPPLLEKWQPVLGVDSADWGIKKRKPSGASATSKRAASGWILNWQRSRFLAWSISLSMN